MSRAIFVAQRRASLLSVCACKVSTVVILDLKEKPGEVFEKIDSWGSGRVICLPVDLVVVAGLVLVLYVLLQNRVVEGYALYVVLSRKLQHIVFT